jgi:hypothetical protein
MLQKMPEILSLSIKIIKVFWERTPGPDPSIFLTSHLRAGVMEQNVKLGQAKLLKRDYSRGTIILSRILILINI